MAPTLTEVRNTLSADADRGTAARESALAIVASPLQIEQLARLRSYIAAGETDHNICVELDVRPSELKQLKKQLYEQESVELNARSTADTYIEYRLRMERICDDLDGVHNGATAARQFTAAMGALKAKAAIIDKVIDRGQDMGLVSRAAKKHEVIGGVAVAHLSDSDLLDKMREIHTTTQTSIEQYGEVSITDIPIPDIYTED